MQTKYTSKKKVLILQRSLIICHKKRDTSKCHPFHKLFRFRKKILPYELEL